MRGRTARALALVLALTLVMSVAAVAPLAGHVDHDCAGEDCPVCDWLARCEVALAVFAAGLLLVVPAAAAVGAVRRERGSRAPVLPERATPVLLGVRLRI